MRIIIAIAILLFTNIVSALPTQPRTEFYWTAPTTNTDNSPLTNLAGFRIYCGTQSGSYNLITDIADPLQVSEGFVNTGLADGAWFCVVTAYTTDDRESDYSNELPFLLVGGVVLVIVPVSPGSFGIR